MQEGVQIPYGHPIIGDICKMFYFGKFKFIGDLCPELQESIPVALVALIATLVHISVMFFIIFR